MTIPSIGSQPVLPPRSATSAVEGEAAPVAEPLDKVTFHVDSTAPHRRLVIPNGEPINPRPFSESKATRFMVAGSVVGGMSGGYLALGLLGSYPVAAASVAVGSAIVGALAGYMATRK